MDTVEPITAKSVASGATQRRTKEGYLVATRAELRAIAPLVLRAVLELPQCDHISQTIISEHLAGDRSKQLEERADRRAHELFRSWGWLYGGMAKAAPWQRALWQALLSIGGHTHNIRSAEMEVRRAAEQLIYPDRRARILAPLSSAEVAS